MKIFSKDSAIKTQAPKSRSTSKEAKGISRVKAEKPIRKDVSSSEIREKLAARVETSEAAKVLAAKNSSQKLGDGFLSEEIKPKLEIPVNEEETTPNKKDFILNSDIANNDPKDTNTQEKLKSVISRGGFNFNPKEREALEKILGNS